MKTEKKKMTFLAALLAGALACAAPIQGFAASLGLTTGSPTLEASLASVDYLVFDSDGDLSTSGAAVDSSVGVSPTGFTELGFGVGFSLTDPLSGFDGGFEVVDEDLIDPLFLGGDLIAVGYTEDVFEFQFGNLVGSAAGDFGDSVLMVVTLFDSLGDNPFAGLSDGEFYDASIIVSSVVPSPVPIPAALPLFLSALVGFGWLGRKQRSKG